MERTFAAPGMLQNNLAERGESHRRQRGGLRQGRADAGQLRDGADAVMAEPWRLEAWVCGAWRGLQAGLRHHASYVGVSHRGPFISLASSEKDWISFWAFCPGM